VTKRDNAVVVLRDWQTSAQVVGPFFEDCYAWLDWLAVSFGELPPVSLRIGKLKHGRMAEYSPADGSMLPTITLDITKSKSGWAAAEWLAHELIHHYQATTRGLTPEEISENHHDDEFQELAMNWGLSVEPRTGMHRGYVDSVWHDVQARFSKETGRHFAIHVLPGPQTPDRVLHKWACPICDFSFRTRRSGVSVECYGEPEEHEPAFMEMVE
jgi:hypothetical protein